MAQQQKLIKTQGNKRLANTMPDWFGICLYADIRPGDPELMNIVGDD
jgi:hypothetical protein